MGNRLLLIGGGGHCHSVIDSVFATGKYKEIGVVAKDQTNYDELLNDAYIGPFLVGLDANLPRLLREEGWNEAFITLGSVGNTGGRRALYSNIQKIGFEMPVIVDPSAIVSDKATIEGGVFIGKRAVVNSGVKIGTCAIINTGAIVEHDCIVGSFAHISPGTTLCGQVTVGHDSHIGAGSVVRQLVEIGSDVLIGAGSVVVKDISDGVKTYGNPCRMVE